MKIRAEVEQAFQPYKIIIEVDSMKEHKSLLQALDYAKELSQNGISRQRDLDNLLNGMIKHCREEECKYDKELEA